MENSKTHHLKDSAAYNKILSSLAEGVIVTDKHGKFTFFNEKAKTILGIGLQDIPPDKWSTVYGCYYPDGITPYPAEELPLAKALRNQHVSNDIIFIRNDERPEGKYINVSASPLSNGTGVVEGGTVVLQDITDNIKAQLAQHESEKRLKAQFMGIPMPTYVWQRNGENFVLVDINDAAIRFTNDKIKKYIGQTITSMYPDNPDIYKYFQKCYTRKKPLSKEMAFHLRSTGEYKDLIVSFVPIARDTILVHIEDITERKKNIATLNKLSQAVEQTADSVMITNRQGIIDYVNPAFERTTGYSRKEI
ncbi:PAS domain S-box protein, partial [candidate division KSB1 bacterium]|nr:PAS domain S-box protein [candidate division KSB1 bacterium]